MTGTEATRAHVTGWDRAAIVALGAAGCALSYDALQQMAVAIHIRGLLTYLFPFVIDGFIGYGVRAVLVMRDASLGARCYVWALFATATAASIWANALHAVRLNDHTGGDGLRLGDTTVGVLSTLAPLALAGAVHLYILIARRAAHSGRRDAVTPDTRAVRDDCATTLPDNGTGQDTTTGRDSTRPVTGHRPSELPAVADECPTADRSGEPVTEPDADPVAATEDMPEREERSTARYGWPDARPGRPNPPRLFDGNASADNDTAEDDLLPLARAAVTDAGKLTRKVVADAVRGEGLPLSNARLTEVMRQLRAEADNRTLRPAG